MLMGVCTVTNLSNELNEVPLCNLQAKMFAHSLDQDELLMQPLLHTIQGEQ